MQKTNKTVTKKNAKNIGKITSTLVKIATRL